MKVPRLLILGCVLWFGCCCGSGAWAAEKKSVAEAKYQQLVDTASPAEIASVALAAAASDKESQELDALGKTLAVCAATAAEVLEQLSQGGSVQAATLRAELLVWLARGDESTKVQGTARHPQTMDSETVGRHAAPLLDHLDPFVRGLAEWALAIRLGAEYEGTQETVSGRRLAKEWPGHAAPPWYQRWASLGADGMLELDYVRQAAALGWHRNATGLLQSASILVARAERLQGYVAQQGTPAQAVAAQTHFAQVRLAYEQLNNAVQAVPADLTEQRKLWLAVRRAVREVAWEKHSSSQNLLAKEVGQPQQESERT